MRKLFNNQSPFISNPLVTTPFSNLDNQGSPPSPPFIDYLILEDGSGFLQLEDGSGNLILE